MSGETFLWFAGYWLFEALRGFGRLVAFYQALLYPRWVCLVALPVMLHYDLLQPPSLRSHDQKFKSCFMWNKQMNWSIIGGVTVQACQKVVMSIGFGCDLNRFPWSVSHDFCPRPTQPIKDVCINLIRRRFDLILLKGKKWKDMRANAGLMQQLALHCNRVKVDERCIVPHAFHREVAQVHRKPNS